MSADLQSKVREVLDEHLPSLLNKTEAELTLFDSVARTNNGRLSEVVVWVRSFDIQEHVRCLIKKIPIDSVVRRGADCSGEPRQSGETVIVRFVKTLPNSVDLLIEFFQVYEDEDSAKEALEGLNSISN